MYQEERLEKMLQVLRQSEKLSSKEAMTQFNVSRDTIRRDFEILAKRQLATRTHGGILLKHDLQAMESFKERVTKANSEKVKIAKQTNQLLTPDKLCFFDVSTTVLALAQIIDKKLTIYSHSLDNALLFADRSEVDFHLLGGQFYSKNRFYFGFSEAEVLSKMSFDFVVIGAAGLKDGLVSYEDESDTYLKKQVMQNAKCKMQNISCRKIKMLSNITSYIRKY